MTTHMPSCQQISAAPCQLTPPPDTHPPTHPAVVATTPCTPPGSQHGYLFNSAPLNWTEAEAKCNAQGGHLVAFASLQEQAAAEQCFASSGALAPAFHKAYWLGLAVGGHHRPGQCYVAAVRQRPLQTSSLSLWLCQLPRARSSLPNL
jgi:hypothetical protein